MIVPKVTTGNEDVSKSYFANKYIQETTVLSKSKKKEKFATFQSAMKLTLCVGQLFGLNPVLGIFEINTTKLSFLIAFENIRKVDTAFDSTLIVSGMRSPRMKTFRILSVRCLYTLLSIAGQLIYLGFCVFQVFKKNATLSSGTSVVFYGTNTLTTILFLRLAAKWPALCRHISKTEAADPNPDYALINKCNLACIIILSLALLEHILSDLAGISVALDCYPQAHWLETFIEIAFPWIFNYITYTHFFGFLALFINLQCTFNWNFADVFVICVSYYLISRLQQVNKRISTVSNKYISVGLWRIMREDYCRVVQLTRTVDEVINGIIFISFANNLYFICVQLLHTLEDGFKGTISCSGLHKGFFGGYEHAVYFVYSFTFLMSRSLAVSLIAARVHSASVEAAPCLYDVPSAAYCIEVKRLIEQINGDAVSLSGLNFFNVKRSLVLSIAGTIITYELVLIQFSGVSPTSAPTTTTTTTYLITNTTTPTPVNT